VTDGSGKADEGGSHPVPTAYSRVTLVSGARRVDLALPDAVPLADVMPQLLRFCAPDEQPDRPVSWTLGRLGGPNLSLVQSLGDAAVADGEILELRPTSTVVFAAYVEDVRDAVEDAVDESGRQWSSRTTVGFALAVASAVLAGVALLPEVRQPRNAMVLSLAAAVAVLGVVGAWWADRRGHPQAAWASGAMAVIWGGLAGWLASLYPAWPSAVSESVSLESALVGAMAIAAIARLATAAVTVYLAAVVLLFVAGLPAAAFALLGWEPMAALRLDAVLAVLMVGVLPRTSLTVGGLAGADYRVRNAGKVTGEELAARIRQSTELLHGGIAAVSVIGVVAGLVLTLAPSTWDRVLGLTVGLALVLRSRVFSRVPHILPVRLAGLFVLVAQGLLAAREAVELGGWIIAVAAGLAVLGVALSAVDLSDVARARIKRLLNLAEMAVVVCMVAVAAGALGVYEWMGGVLG
jgi:type VII secretion integral membrane protein EccD